LPDGRHRLALSDDDVATLNNAIQSHSAVLHQAANVLSTLRGDTSSVRREADKLAHVSSLIQIHQRGCLCPSAVGGT